MSESLAAPLAPERDTLADVLSCLSRLAAISGSSLADRLVEAIDQLPPATELVDSTADGEQWKVIKKSAKCLDKISTSLDGADVERASGAVMQLCTTMLHRHAREREQFFSTGRGVDRAPTVADPLEAACAQVVQLMDSVLPEIRNTFQTLAEEDSKAKAIAFVEAQHQHAHQERLQRIARAQVAGKAVRQRKLDARRRQQETDAQLLSLDIAAQKEARIQYEAFHAAKAEKFARAEQRAVEDRKEKQRVLKQCAAVERERRMVELQAAKTRHGHQLRTTQCVTSLAKHSKGATTKARHRHGAEHVGSLLPPFKSRNMAPPRPLMTASGLFGAGCQDAIDLREACIAAHKSKLTGTWSQRNLCVNSPLSPTDVLSDGAHKRPRPAPIAIPVEEPTIVAVKSPSYEVGAGKVFGDGGAVITPWDMMDESELLVVDFSSNEAPLRTLLSVLSPGAQKYAEETSADEIDTSTLSELTGMSAQEINAVLALFVAQAKSAHRTLKIDPFKRLMRKLHFHNAIVTNRLFEVFNTAHRSAINFSELLVGLSFFIHHRNTAEKTANDPLLLDYITRLLDLDGQETVSKFKFYNIVKGSVPREFVSVVTEAVWDVISVKLSLTYQEFQAKLNDIPALLQIIHQIVLFQGIPHDSPAYGAALNPVIHLSESWRRTKAAGRIYALDDLANKFMATSDATERTAISFSADLVASGKKGPEGIVAAYYVKVMRMIMDSGPNYADDESKTITNHLKRDIKRREAHAMQKRSPGEAEEADGLNPPFLEESTKITLEWRLAVLDVFLGRTTEPVTERVEVRTSRNGTLWVSSLG